MVGEIGAATVQINSDRVSRESSVQTDRLQQNKESEVEQQAQGFSDVTSFSAEALALSRQVIATSGNTELQGTEARIQDPQEVGHSPYNPIDVLA